MKNDEKEAVEYFITAVEVNDPEEIMAQVRNMQMCMDLPHVNLLHAEAWLWEEFRDDFATWIYHEILGFTWIYHEIL